MTTQWKEKRVGEVLRLEYGKPLDDADRKPDGRYAVYGANGEKARSDKFYVDRASIIVGRKGSAGEVNLAQGKFWPLDVTYFVTFDERQHELRFLYYLLTTLDLPNFAKGVKPGINRNEVYSQVTRIPSLPEQQRIVGILDKAFKGIETARANAEKNLQNARAIFESHLQSVFTQRGEGWVEKRLDQLGTTQTGSTPKTSDRENYGDFIPFLKPADFKTDGSLDYENDSLSEKGLSEARKVPAGSVLMVCIGATIGKCGYSARDVTTNQQINALTPSGGVSHEFVYYQMRTENFQRRVLLSSAQATLPIINKSKWSALTVALPPKLEEQRRIAAKFEALCGEAHHLESVYQQKLAALDALKKSLLHQAFSGQL